MNRTKTELFSVKCYAMHIASVHTSLPLHYSVVLLMDTEVLSVCVQHKVFFKEHNICIKQK